MITSVAQPEDIVTRMECLADPTRLRLLKLLETQELGVADLCKVLQLPQSTVSRHLRILSEHGWTHSRRSGTANLYQMLLEEMQTENRDLWQVTREHLVDMPTFAEDQRRLSHLLTDRKSSQAFFAGAAADWHRMREAAFGWRFNLAAVTGILPRNWVVADLGCGVGDLTYELAQQIRMVLAVDNSSQMLKAARGRCGDLTNVEWVEAELTDVPLRTSRCDAAMLVLSLSYVDDVLAVLSEAVRITKRGGSIVIIDLAQHDRNDFRRQMGQQCNGFLGSELEKVLLEAGMADIRLRDMAPDPSAQGPTLLCATGKVA